MDGKIWQQKFLFSCENFFLVLKIFVPLISPKIPLHVKKSWPLEHISGENSRFGADIVRHSTTQPCS
jgi:hypothetical protein